MKYTTKITGWGEDALGFLSMGEDENSFLIIFNDNAPAELAEICVLHEIAELKEDPAVGDTVQLGDKKYTITAVGEEAKHTLRELGHCTLTFQNDAEPERPGCIMLDGEAPSEADITVGTVISIS